MHSPLAWAFAGAFTAVVAAFPRVLLLDETFVLKDWLQYAVPSHEILASAIRELRFPAWSDALRFGIPFGANPDHRALYLPYWLLAVLPSPLGSDLIVIVHVMAGGVAVGLLASRWGGRRIGAAFSASLYAASGFVTSSVVLQMTTMLAWIPWIAWAADRVARSRRHERVRSGVLFAACYSGILVCAEPASVITATFLAVVVVGARARDRKAYLVAAAGAVGGACLAAPVIFPALGLVGASSRTHGLDVAAATRFSMHPLRMLESVWPGALGGPSNLTSIARVVADSAGLDGTSGDVSWSESLFVGAPALILAALALRRRRWLGRPAAAAGAFAVLAMGHFTPVYPLYRAVFLPERAARFPEKYFVGAVLIVAALAGVGLCRWSRARARRAETWAAVAVAVVLLAAWVFVFASRERLGAFLAARAAAFPFPLDAAAGIEAALGGGAVAVVGAAAFAAAFWRGPRPASPVRTAALVAAAVLPLVPNAWRVNPTVPRELVSKPPAILGPALPATGGVRPRLLVQPPPFTTDDLASDVALARHAHENARDDIASRFGLQVVSGTDSFDTPAQDAIWNGGELAAFPLRYAALGGAEFAIVHRPLVIQVGGAVESAHGFMALMRVAYRRPRAFVTTRWAWVAPGEDVSSIEAPGRIECLECVALTGTGPAPTSFEVASACEVFSERPEHVVVRCASPAGGYAVLLDAHAAGWTARVDGIVARIELADALFRAVKLEPGEHVIDFRYEVPGLVTGLIVGMLAWLVLVGVLLRTRTAQRTAPPGAAAPGTVPPCGGRGV